MKTYQMWSGGKDSTASIILEHIHGLPKSEIVFCEVMFDIKKGISGEDPEHIEFIHSVAIPKFKEWGYDVTVLRADTDYKGTFYKRACRSANHPERVGKFRGFVLGGLCTVKRDCKLAPIHKYTKQKKEEGYAQIIGIAVDEPERLARLKGNDYSLLERYGYTEKMCRDLCKEKGLLSPIYDSSTRGGCWFCPNARIKEFAKLKQDHPDYWEELRTMSKTPNLVSQNFKWSKTFAEVDKEVDEYIEAEKAQISIWDL